MLGLIASNCVFLGIEYHITLTPIEQPGDLLWYMYIYSICLNTYMYICVFRDPDYPNKLAREGSMQSVSFQ